MERLLSYLAGFPELVRFYRTARTRLGRFRRRLYLGVCAYCNPMLRAYFRLAGDFETSLRDRTLDAYSKNCSNFVVLQVGANDGFSRDPVHKFIVRDRWSGILVEPQPMVFEQELKQTYRAHSNIHLVNAAVDEVSGSKEFYRIAFSQDRWATGLSSLSRSALEKQIRDGWVGSQSEIHGQKVPEEFADQVESVLVPTVTFEQLLDGYDLERLDLLQLDCEGYDFELLKAFPFNRVLPSFINFEALHMSESERREILALLEGLNYSCNREGLDIFCELS